MSYTIGDGMVAFALAGGILGYLYLRHQGRQKRIEGRPSLTRSRLIFKILFCLSLIHLSTYGHPSKLEHGALGRPLIESIEFGAVPGAQFVSAMGEVARGLNVFTGRL